MKLTLATWNVLADCYSKAVRKGSGSTCKNEDDFKAILNWSSRLKHINRCLTECTADIICLQEVDHYEDSFKINLVDIGYQMVYLKRPLKDDGCLIAFKSSKFSLVGTSEINLDDLVIINTGKKTGSTSRNKFAKQNVALMVQLQCLSTSQLINVCTCHIHWNPNLLDVKLAQVKYILSQLYQYRILSLLKYKLNTSHQNPHSDLSIKPIPIIFTGDFNSMPHDFIYNTVTTRFSCANDIASVSLSTEQLMASGCDLSGGGVADGASEGVPYSGSRTRFLCDATMYKLGKWMRVLGINVAIDGWESTDKKERSKRIEAFFQRARTEKRIILTTSKTLRERTNCPHSLLIAHGDMKRSLVDLYVEYRLPLNIMNFLTVCIKCGDDICPVQIDDPCMKDKPHVPTDRPLFACVSCFQPYWWSEEANSSPAKALRKAEDLYNIVYNGLLVRAPDCEGSRHILAGMRTRDCRDIVSGRRYEIESSISVDGMVPREEEEEEEEEEETGMTYMSEGPLVRTGSLLEGATAPTDSEGEQKADEESTPVLSYDNEEEEDEEEVEEEGLDETTEAPHVLQLRSVFARLERPEPAMTNWNGEFRATLDYIFVTDDWTVHNARVWPRVAVEDFENIVDSQNGEVFSTLSDIVVSCAQPSSQWPSDHFMIITELSMDDC